MLHPNNVLMHHLGMWMWAVGGGDRWLYRDCLSSGGLSSSWCMVAVAVRHCAWWWLLQGIVWM